MAQDGIPVGRGDVAALMSKRRYCWFIPISGFVEGHGFRPSLVFEGEPGHYPNGTWPYTGHVGETMPYFWGDDYDQAVKCADEMNDRLGVSKRLAAEIVASSMAAQHRRVQREELSMGDSKDGEVVAAKRRLELREAIREHELEHEQAQHRYLRETGWSYTSSTPGCFWLWCKALPDGRTVLVQTSLAIDMQQKWLDYKEGEAAFDAAEEEAFGEADCG